jgi:hypothetical protein
VQLAVCAELGDHERRGAAVVLGVDDLRAVPADVGILRACSVRQPFALGLVTRRRKGAVRQDEELVVSIDAAADGDGIENGATVASDRCAAVPLHADRELLSRRRISVERETIKAGPPVPVVAVIEKLRGSTHRPRRGRHEPNVPRDLPFLRQAPPFPYTARLRSLHLVGVVLREMRRPSLVELFVGSPGGAPDRSVDGPRDDLPAVVVDDGAERPLAVDVRDPAEKLRTVEVPNVSLRPAPHEVRHLIERRQAMLEHVGAQVHVEQRRAQAPAARVRRLFEHGEPLQDPLRLRAVGEPPFAGDAIDERGNATRAVGVNDVRVLVGDQLELPIVVVAERRQIFGRRHPHVNRVVGERVGVPVGVVGVIAQHDVRDVVELVPQDRCEPRVHPLGHGGDLLRRRLEPFVIVDAEVRRLDRPPLEIGITRRDREPRPPEHRHDERKCGDEARPRWALARQGRKAPARRHKSS